MNFDQFYEKTVKKILKGYQDTCIELSVRTDRRTPVDKGTLRKSWTPSKNSPDTSNRGGDIESICRSLTLKDIYWFTNAQPYARVIEYTGHSPQAPRGMMRISVAEFGQVARVKFRG